MATNYVKLHEKQIDKLIEENEALNKENKRLKNIEKILLETNSKIDALLDMNKLLLESNKELKKSIEEKDEIISKQADEIQRLKNNNNKDSSNSSKPSSTNGSKIIPNSREKSNKKAGGQHKHEPHTLKAKDIEVLIKDKKNVKYITKTIDNLNKKYPKYVIDLVVDVLITENKNGNIDKLNEVQYGETIKSIVILLATDNYMSYDGIIKFISALTNNTIQLSKGTLVNWINGFTESLNDEITTIENGILDGYYVNADDSAIKINGNNYNQLCLCNASSVLLYASKTKSKEAWDKTILSKYVGIIIKDGTKVYDKYNNIKGQCCAHIIRYLKGAYEFSEKKHGVPKKISNFLRKINEDRSQKIAKEISSFTEDEIAKYLKEYDYLIELWGKELEGESKIIYKDEINLYNRMKDDQKDEILRFITDFKIPFTNNNAESAQRGIKVKQKIGKFRSENGAADYCTIKSFILSVKKRNISVIESIKNILVGRYVLSK